MGVFFSQDSGLKITSWYITQTLQLYQNKHNWHLEWLFHAQTIFPFIGLMKGLVNYTNTTSTLIAVSKGSVLLRTESELLQDGGETESRGSVPRTIENLHQ